MEITLSFFHQGTWENSLWLHFKWILLHIRIFLVLVHWEIVKKNWNWKEDVTTFCTVHRIFMILKSILFWFSIQKSKCKNDLMVYWFSCWSFAWETGVQFPMNTQYFCPLHWFYLKKSWNINLFNPVSCQGTKTVMLLLHTDMILKQYPIEFC